ncbi:MAG: hypothetical protein Q8907_15270 [Bacteroidota bacterium]|nr:hypothetical protein [Bacteroidota bacterium]
MKKLLIATVIALISITGCNRSKKEEQPHHSNADTSKTEALAVVQPGSN